MLAQRFVAICDWPECRQKTRALVVLRMKPAHSGLQHPIVMTPQKLILPDGWSWSWVTEKSATQIFCKRHTRERARRG